MMLEIKNCRLGNDDLNILTEGRTISGVLPAQEGMSPDSPGAIDVDGARVFPGFCDLQINGSFGFDFVSQPESLWQVAEKLPEFGVTSFLPTLITCEEQQIEAFIAVLEQGPPKNHRGAIPLGFHAEGPLLAPARKGAHDGTLMRSPRTFAPKWLDSPHLKMLTLAPELDGAYDLIKRLSDRGIIVALGHSDATSEEAKLAIDAGATYGTHLFNAMSGIHHRKPGLAAELLDNTSATCGLIVDGIHLHDSMVRFAWKMKGKAALSLVSDAAAGAGMPDGPYQLGGFDVFVADGAVRLADGTIAGSALTLDQAIRNLRQVTSCTWESAVHTVTTVPARLLGHPTPKIWQKAPATMTFLNRHGDVLLTVIEGIICYQRKTSELD